MGPGLTATALGAGAQIAGNQVKNQLMRSGTSAITGSAAPAWASGAAGMGAGIGISMAGNALANKFKPKEEMPITGGQHADILDGYGRRLEGAGPGAHGGAIRGATMGANPALAAATGGISVGVGALGGLIAGLATKNATSAYSDYSANDAYDAIGKGYQKYLGRDASDEEIMGRLKGQGYDPSKGHKYVGEGGLRYHMDEIAGSPEAQAYLQRSQGAPSQTTSAPSATPPPVLPQGSAPASGAPTPVNTPSSPLATSPGQSYTQYQSSQGGPNLPQLQPDGSYSSPSNTGVAGNIVEQAQQSGGGFQPTPPNPSWNTEGYSAPAYLPQSVGNVMPGWDQTNWNDPNMQTPKYGVGRILSNYPPSIEGAQAAMPEILKAYPGATFDGKDKLTIPGVGTTDILRNAGGSDMGWQWPDAGGGAGMTTDNMMSMAQGGNLQAPQLDQKYYSNSTLQQLLQQMGLDKAATSIGG